MTTETMRVNPPMTIIAAFFGFLASSISALAGIFVVLGYRGELAAALSEADAALTGERLDQAVLLVQGFVIAVAVVTVILNLWLSFKLKAGRNWARVVLTVLTLLQLASVLAAQATWAGYLTCAISVLAMVSSYLPPSNAYIAGAGRAA